MPRPSNEIGEPRSVLDLCDEAIARLRSIGFERAHVSMKSEATYWRLPGRHGLLRVATHPSKRPPIGMDAVHACVTFRGPRRGRDVLVCSQNQIEQMLTWAIGQYVMRSFAPMPSRYEGPKWELAERRLNGAQT